MKTKYNRTIYLFIYRNDEFFRCGHLPHDPCTRTGPQTGGWAPLLYIIIYRGKYECSQDTLECRPAFSSQTHSSTWAPTFKRNIWLWTAAVTWWRVDLSVMMSTTSVLFLTAITEGYICTFGVYLSVYMELILWLSDDLCPVGFMNSIKQLIYSFGLRAYLRTVWLCPALSAWTGCTFFIFIFIFYHITKRILCDWIYFQTLLLCLIPLCWRCSWNDDFAQILPRGESNELCSDITMCKK